jgi:hypothetical protein
LHDQRQAKAIAQGNAAMFEYQDIFASHLTTAVFIFASIAMLIVNAGSALALGLKDEAPPRVRILPRAI